MQTSELKDMLTSAVALASAPEVKDGIEGELLLLDASCPRIASLQSAALVPSEALTLLWTVKCLVPLG